MLQGGRKKKKKHQKMCLRKLISLCRLCSGNQGVGAALSNISQDRVIIGCRKRWSKPRQKFKADCLTLAGWVGASVTAESQRERPHARDRGIIPPARTGRGWKATSGGCNVCSGPCSHEWCAKTIFCLIINSADSWTLQSMERALYGNYLSCAESNIKTDGKDCIQR